jgi:Zn-dependent M28 family amino/carboxypeptidase
MMRNVSFTVWLFIITTSVSCKSQTKSKIPSVDDQIAEINKGRLAVAKWVLDSAAIINSLRFLASDSCEGRKPGSTGHKRAAQRIAAEFRLAGVDSFKTGLFQLFNGRYLEGYKEGKNIIGWIKGKTVPQKYIVISAHYDHLGKNDKGETYYGADDNASGAACLAPLAKYFKEKRHPYSLIFVAFDREETGLEGAYSFVANAKDFIGEGTIVMNVNIDMLARSDNNEIYACGVNHFPQFKPVIEKIRTQTSVKLLMGHDYGSHQDDWTFQGDHYAFYKRQIPFIYFGVENHEDYHKPSDTFDRISLSGYIENCNLVANLIWSLNQGIVEK